MAAVNFYSGFEYKWGQTGGVIDLQDDQYKLGWAFIGSTPPSVEQFNKLQQLNDEKFAWLWGQFKSAASARKVTLGANDLLGLNKLLTAATPDASVTVKGMTAYASDAEAAARTIKTKALTPYGLGLNLQSSARDTTAGKILTVGAFGLGRAGADTTTDAWPAENLSTLEVGAGMYYVPNAQGAASNLPAGVTNQGVVFHRQSGSGGGQLYASFDGELAWRGRRSGEYTAWNRALAVGDYGLGAGTVNPANGRDSVNPFGWYYQNRTTTWGGGSFFLDMPYGTSLNAGLRLSTDPYTDNFYLNGGVSGKKEYRAACKIWHDKNFDPDSKADKSASIPTFATAPKTNEGPVIYAIDRQQFLQWQTIGSFTGYASLNVGRFVWGTSRDARADELDAIGQVVAPTNTRFVALVAWAEANGHVVAPGDWKKGAFVFSRVSAGSFRLPDLRDQFIRATGTDADTANARLLGSSQNDAVERIVGSMRLAEMIGGVPSTGVFLEERNPVENSYRMAGAGFSSTVSFDSKRVARSSVETRPVNTSLHPRIQI